VGDEGNPIARSDASSRSAASASWTGEAVQTFSPNPQIQGSFGQMFEGMPEDHHL
jgi:hypothetical protein